MLLYNNNYYRFNCFLPGHALALHRIDSTAFRQGPLPQLRRLQVVPLGHWHAAPPPDQVHLLLLVFIPPPHEDEHELKADH